MEILTKEEIEQLWNAGHGKLGPAPKIPPEALKNVPRITLKDYRKMNDFDDDLLSFDELLDDMEEAPEQEDASKINLSGIITEVEQIAKELADYIQKINRLEESLKSASFF